MDISGLEMELREPYKVLHQCRSSRLHGTSADAERAPARHDRLVDCFVVCRQCDTWAVVPSGTVERPSRPVQCSTVLFSRHGYVLGIMHAAGFVRLSNLRRNHRAG